MSVVSIKNITKQFGDYKAVDDVSFEVEKGRVVGLIGPNGAGKTTTIRMITNILMPDSGTISVFGEPAGASAQNKLGYLPEERGLYKKIKVIEQLIYFGQLKGMSKDNAKSKALYWLKTLDAEDWANKKIQELSKGMQQKVQFISTILHEPELLILDEPFSGFDPVNADILKSIIMDLKAAGKTIILSTHVMEQAEQLCDDIRLINKGRLMLSGKLREIKSRFGRDTVIMEYEGDGSFMNDFDNIKFINRSQSRLEFRIEDGIEKAQAILKAALEKCTVFKFNLVEPSLHEIFVETVSGKEQQNG